MLSKSSQSCTPSPYGYSPCLGESADDHVECIHCLSLWPLAKAAAFDWRPKGSVNRQHCPSSRGRSETFRELAKCQSVPSEGPTRYESVGAQ